MFLEQKHPQHPEFNKSGKSTCIYFSVFFFMNMPVKLCIYVILPVNLRRKERILHAHCPSGNVITLDSTPNMAKAVTRSKMAMANRKGSIGDGFLLSLKIN